MRGLIILVIVLVLALIGLTAMWIDTRARGARKDRRERARHEKFLHDLLVRCIDARDFDLFAATTADDIRNHLNPPRKEVRS